MRSWLPSRCALLALMHHIRNGIIATYTKQIRDQFVPDWELELV
jgi:hypothetical protein